MMQPGKERYGKPAPDLQEKLEASRAGAEKLELREIKCPVCGFYLLDVYGRDHHFTRVKCRKCKFDEVIDTALFRTMERRRRRKQTALRRTRSAR